MHRILPIVVFILLAATSISAQNATTKLRKIKLEDNLHVKPKMHFLVS